MSQWEGATFNDMESEAVTIRCPYCDWPRQLLQEAIADGLRMTFTCTKCGKKYVADFSPVPMERLRDQPPPERGWTPSFGGKLSKEDRS